MLLLTSTSDLVNVQCGASVASIAVHCSWVDINGTTVTPGRLNTVITSSTSLTQVVGSPASSTQRNVKLISICNTSATACQVTIQHTDGTNVVTLANPVLQPSNSLTYNDLEGWGLIDSNGGVCDSPLQGRLTNTTLLTATTATNFTTGGTTTVVRIRGVGGGAGGGGCAAVASATGAAGGGGAGGYLEAFVPVSPNTAYSYTCGAAGNGSAGAIGGNGSNSTFTIGSTTYTAEGGSGGPLCTPVVTGSQPLAVAGGAGGLVSLNGTLNGAGQPGNAGISLSLTIFNSGEGGSGPFGGGGLGLGAAGVGNNAAGYGAGGGGSAATTNATRAGGNGTQGIWIVDEYS